MKPEVALDMLQDAAKQLGVLVSYEQLWTAAGAGAMRGGVCRVKRGDGMVWRVIIDKRATAEERVATLAAALATFDTGALELPDKLRELLRLHEASAKHRRTAA
jgi:hypothetical protein